MSIRSLTAVILVAVAGCVGASPLDTADEARLGSSVRAIGPDGVTQTLTVVVDPPDLREPGFHTLLATSNVTNTGSAPASVTARTCLFVGDDLQITAEADRFEPFVSCSAVEQSTTLAPGESVGPMEVRYRLRSGPGLYTVRVRHSLDPELRAEATFRIP